MKEPLKKYLRKDTAGSSIMHGSKRLLASVFAIACLLLASILLGPVAFSFKTAEALPYHTLIINSVSNGGTAISGYFGLWQGSNFKAWNTGSSIVYTLQSGSEYTITPVNTGGYIFDHWTDSSSPKSRTITISSDTVLTAVYNAPPSATNSSLTTSVPVSSIVSIPTASASGTSTLAFPASTGSSSCGSQSLSSATTHIPLPSLTIKSVSNGGTAISGYFGLWQGSNFKAWNTGSSIVYTLQSGSEYTITPVNTGGYIFDHWTDSSSPKSRTITISSDTVLTAVYRSASEPPTACAPLTPLPVTTPIASPPAVSPPTPTQIAQTPSSSTSVTSSTPEPNPTPIPTPPPPPATTPPPPIVPVSSPSGPLARISSGLQESDSLTNGNFDSNQLNANNPNGWRYFGSGPSTGAPFAYSMDTTRGLHLGVQALSSGNWAGLYAVTPNTPSTLYHAVLTLDSGSLASDAFNTGLYVQTANGLINYVTCVGVLTSSGPIWEVVRTTGDNVHATSFETLWIDTSGGQPLSRDCTIITNGSNFLQVYLDGSSVYSSSSLNLQMPSPFNAYLEVQSSTPSGMLFSSYKDYYSTSSQFISVTGAPVGDVVKIVSSGSGNEIARATVGSDGTAQLDVGAFHMPLAGSVQVFTADGKNVVSSGDNTLWAGDVYSMRGA